MKDNLEKIIIAILVIGGIYYLLTLNNLKENEYRLKINDPYTVCGEKVYFTDSSHNNEISINEIVETVKNVCKVEEMENILDEHGLLP